MRAFCSMFRFIYIERNISALSLELEEVDADEYLYDLDLEVEPPDLSTSTGYSVPVCKARLLLTG